VNTDSLHETTHTLSAANGTPIPLLGEITLPIHIGSYSTSVTGLVSEHIEEVMLGIDWLTANNVVWEFGDARIKIGNKLHNLSVQRGNKQWCRRVTLQENTMIPARSEMDIKTKVICRPWKGDRTDIHWGTEPNTIRTGVHVSRTLIPNDRLYDIPVRVINVTSEPIMLSVGTQVANLQ